MGLCKGNLGNLLQHFVLMETLGAIRQRFSKHHLLFVASHAMAPWSVPSRRDGRGNGEHTFDLARLHLDRACATDYERVWLRLSAAHGLPYPCSAAFVVEAWNGQVSLLLCESDPGIAAEIKAWLVLPEINWRLAGRELYEGDWRIRFSAATKNEADLIYVEMDPMRFERHDAATCRRTPASLYPEDLETVSRAFESDRPTLVQITSYTANNDNPHDKVEQTISCNLMREGFSLLERVKADGHMVSFVYGRNVAPWPPSDAPPPNQKFHAWLEAIGRKTVGRHPVNPRSNRSTGSRRRSATTTDA
ncbi:MAG: hypothetical protein M3O15_13995 [Acidobacteriota bacterium]|nr:hypothetical protein [Acidobacteriota bacterium]